MVADLLHSSFRGFLKVELEAKALGKMIVGLSFASLIEYIT